MNDRQYRKLAIAVGEMIEAIEGEMLLTDDRLIEAAIRLVIAARDVHLPVGKPITPALTADLNRTVTVLQEFQEAS